MFSVDRPNSILRRLEVCSFTTRLTASTFIVIRHISLRIVIIIIWIVDVHAIITGPAVIGIIVASKT